MQFSKESGSADMPDRLPMTEWASWWDKTLNRWGTEGLSDFYNADKSHEALASANAIYCVPNGTSSDEISTPIDLDLLRDRFGHDPWRQFWIGGKKSGFPEMAHGQGPVTDTASYEALLPYLYLEEPIKNVKDSLLSLKENYEKGEVLVWLTLEGFFWWPRVLFGIEDHLYAFVDEPELMHRIVADQANYCLRVIDAFCEILTPDFMTFAEDMSYNLGPMLSENLFNTFLKPGYDKVIPTLKEKGIRVIIDSDGEVSEMVPWLLNAGIEGILPLERQAGCDVAQLRRDHPNLLMIGAFDKMIMKEGKEAMENEFIRLLPTMKTGGFIPSVDHQTPPDVSLEQYLDYMILLEKYCRLAVEK